MGYHLMNPAQANTNVVKAVRTTAIKYGTAKEPYIAIKSDGCSKWYIDTKTSPLEGYYTPQQWLRIWEGANIPC